MSVKLKERRSAHLIHYRLEYSSTVPLNYFNVLQLPKSLLSSLIKILAELNRIYAIKVIPHGFNYVASESPCFNKYSQVVLVCIPAKSSLLHNVGRGRGLPSPFPLLDFLQLLLLSQPLP